MAIISQKPPVLQQNRVLQQSGQAASVVMEFAAKQIFKKNFIA